MNRKVNILGFAGSLRQGSYNRALLRETRGLLPANANLEIFELDGMPPYNDDLLASMPEKVREFKEKIRAADALLIVTPEYNHSVPGVLKNAIDWASRPPEDNPFEGKPAAIMSASTGMLGGARAQYHLRQVLVSLNVHTVNRPQIFVNFAGQKFDSGGKLKDEKTGELVKTLLESLIGWAKKLK